MGATRQLTGGPVTTPDGTPIPGAEIRIILVDAATRRPCTAVDTPTSGIVIGRYTAIADPGGMVDFPLWPNDRGERQTLYAVEITGHRVRPFYAVVPESDAPLDWLAFVTGGQPLDPSEVTALQAHLADDDRHLLPDERAALTAASAPSATNPIATLDDVIAAGGFVAYDHDQSAPAAQWTVNHNLGRRTAVELISTGGAEMDAEIVHTSVNQFIAYFNMPVAGTARCL